MTIPTDVLVKQEMFGHVEVAWIGDVEVSITADAGSGSLLVHAVNHATYTGDRPELVFSAMCGTIGAARWKFGEICKRIEGKAA